MSKRQILTCDQFLNKLKRKNKHYAEGLFKIVSDYKGSKERMLVQDKYGIMSSFPGDLCNGKKPGIRTAVDKTSYYINKVKEVHGDYYDYSNVKYTKWNDHINVTCRTHGDFSVTPSNHLTGVGCKKCTIGGFSHSAWVQASQLSRKFDSYKVYVINMFDDNESFYKIGKTFNTVEYRMRKGKIPYEYNIIDVYEYNDPKECSIKEKQLHKLNADFMYLPIKNFGGNTECFSQLNIIE